MSYPKEHFHDLPLQTNSGRRNAPLCNVRGQATRGRERWAHKDRIYLRHSASVYGPHIRHRLSEGCSQLPAHASGLDLLTGKARKEGRKHKKQRCQKCCRGLGAGSQGQSGEDGQISHVCLYPICLHPKHGEAFNVWLRHKCPGGAPGRRRARPAVPRPDAGSAFARARRAGRALQDATATAPPAAHFHDNRGADRVRRTGVRDAHRPPRGASGSRLRGVAAPPATYLARPARGAHARMSRRRPAGSRARAPQLQRRR